MRIKIRSKLILGISFLIIILFLAMAYLFINEKKEEMANDIYLNSLAFSSLTADSVVYDYDLYLAQNSFVYFNRNMQSLFKQNNNVKRIAVLDYSKELLYDSAVDVDSKYDGHREVDELFLEHLKSENISLRLKNGDIFYLKEDDFVNLNEEKIKAFEKKSLINYLIIPSGEEYFVAYYLDYSAMDERVLAMVKRILYLALFGIMLGILMAFYLSGRLTKPISKLVEASGQISKGNFLARADIATNDELRDLGDSFNKMAKNLKESMTARLYQARVTQELSIATKIQVELIPKNIPQVKGLDIAAGLIPAEEIGGDIYDFMFSNDGDLLMYLGDVTGHGVPAGIVSSLANALFYGFRDLDSLSDILVKVNGVMKAKTVSTMFMTLCLMEWSISRQKFKYISAGHEQIIHYKASDGSVELKKAGGVALGMVKDISPLLKVVDIELEIGDFLVIYSDGIPEAWKSQTESYGMERFMKAIKEFGDLQTALGIKEAILADVEQFTNGYQQMDDITVMVLKREK